MGTIAPAERNLVSLVVGLTLWHASLAGPPTGTVRDAEGRALEGATVTILTESPGKRISVYTDASGRYAFNETPGAAFALRVRRMGAAEILVPEVDPTETGTHDFVLQSATEEELMLQLPPNVWAERILIDDPEQYRMLRLNCMICHQQGNDFTRWPRSRSDWEQVFSRMAHKGAWLDSAESRDVISNALLDAYDVEKHGLPRIPRHPKGAETRVEITEWLLPYFGNLHDVAPGPDGRVYGADIHTNIIARLDPRTDEIKALDDPKSVPEDNRGGLHTVLEGPDGKSMWFTYTMHNLVARLDIETETLEEYRVFELNGFYPHTMRFSADGNVWFTLAASNQLGMVDTRSGEIDLHGMPTRTWWQWMLSNTPVLATVFGLRMALDVMDIDDVEELPTPYGIDVAPNGIVWVGLWNNRGMVAFDPDTEESELVDTPFGGPRRFRIDSKGSLWIPAFVQGQVFRYVPSTREWTPFDLPTGRGDSHYALTVSPADDSVWVAGSNSNTIMRLDPESGEVLVYRLPSLYAWARELYFDAAGDLWTSYSNDPATLMEGGTGTFVRLRFLPEEQQAAR